MTVPDQRPIDVRQVVTDIETEVARKRAAGAYPPELLARLRLEFAPQECDEPPEALALILSSRPLLSNKPMLGKAIVFGKKLTRRLLSWYVHPIAHDQTRFNNSILRELRSVERRLRAVETPWERPSGIPAGSGPEPQSRAEALAAALKDAPGGPTLLIGGGDGVATQLRSRIPELLTPSEISPAGGLGPEPLGPLERLKRTSADSLAAVVLAGVLPCMSAAELLGLGSTVARVLRSGGMVVMDAPDPTDPSRPLDPSSVDIAMQRWLAPSTVALLWEAAGLEVRPTRVIPGSEPAWFVSSARR